MNVIWNSFAAESNECNFMCSFHTNFLENKFLAKLPPPPSRSMPHDLVYGKSTMVVVMSRYCKAINHYLNQRWQSSMMPYGIIMAKWVNTLRPGQNGRYFADDIFKWIFLNENAWTPIKISLKFVPKGPINNIPALVQVMAWRRLSDKPLSEPMITDAYMRHSA